MKTKFTWLRFVVALVVIPALVLTACGGSASAASPPTPTPAPPPTPTPNPLKWYGEPVEWSPTAADLGGDHFVDGLTTPFGEDEGDTLLSAIVGVADDGEGLTIIDMGFPADWGNDAPVYVLAPGLDPKMLTDPPADVWTVKLTGMKYTVAVADAGPHDVYVVLRVDKG